MDSRVKITANGEVYMYVPLDSVEIFAGMQYDLCMLDGSGNFVPVTTREHLNKCIENEEDMFVFVGDMTGFHKVRLSKFLKLEDVRDFINTYKRCPWGITTIAKVRGWRGCCERGFAIVLVDENDRVLRYKAFGNIVTIDGQA